MNATLRKYFDSFDHPVLLKRDWGFLRETFHSGWVNSEGFLCHLPIPLVMRACDVYAVPPNGSPTFLEEVGSGYSC